MTNLPETENERKMRVVSGWAFTIFTFGWWICAVGSVTFIVGSAS